MTIMLRPDQKLQIIGAITDADQTKSLIESLDLPEDLWKDVEEYLNHCYKELKKLEVL